MFATLSRRSDWDGGALGVRLRYEPKDLESLYKDFLDAFDVAQTMRATAEDAQREKAEGKKLAGVPPKLTIWPNTLIDFLGRRRSQHFKIRAYLLDPGRGRCTREVTSQTPDARRRCAAYRR